MQIFIAMQPDETVYFSNPGPDGKFNKDFYFHWADANNEPLNNWKDIAQYLLSIPMAHHRFRKNTDQLQIGSVDCSFQGCRQGCIPDGQS